MFGVVCMKCFKNTLFSGSGWLIPLFIVVFASFLTLLAFKFGTDRDIEEEIEEGEVIVEVILSPEDYRNTALAYPKRRDKVFSFLASPEAAPAVFDFYTAIIGSEKIATLIVEEALKTGVLPSLAVALAWEESRFVSTAVNRNRTSVDRGLFQLNNRSFPKLEEADFFDIELNVKLGVEHLRWCLEHGGNDVAGLAMYNAGTGRVRKNTTPKSTLDYVHRILNFKTGIDVLFEEEMSRSWYLMPDGSVRSLAPTKPESIALAGTPKPRLLKLKTNEDRL